MDMMKPHAPRTLLPHTPHPLPPTPHAPYTTPLAPCTMPTAPHPTAVGRGCNFQKMGMWCTDGLVEWF